jgi:hypothetical protein
VAAERGYLCEFWEELRRLVDKEGDPWNSVRVDLTARTDRVRLIESYLLKVMPDPEQKNA